MKKNKNENNWGIRFLYGTKMGNRILQWILEHHVDFLIVLFLESCLSKSWIPFYIRKHGISMREFEGQSYGSFAEFFVRKRPDVAVDLFPGHLISPCDGWLSAYPIERDSSFYIKGFHYRLEDFLLKNSAEFAADDVSYTQEANLCKAFEGGMCLIFRLCASDYHHYCYIDDGFQGANHYIPGELHSVQPLACETYPVYTLNRREWSLLESEHFGPVIQVEIGALIVGGIVNEQENTRVKKGIEKGRFELCGSTIVLLFQKNQIELLPEVKKILSKGEEYQVKQGMWIGNGAARLESSDK